MAKPSESTGLNRRTFLATSSAAIAGAAMGAMAPQSEAATQDPNKGGTLRFGTRLDADGLDSHRNNQYHTSHSIAAIYTGLTDINQIGDIVPGIAESYEPSKDLMHWTFRLRKGVLFHNGREVDADAVKQNLMRIKDPAIGSGWHRGTIKSIDTVDVVDKYTVKINLSVPDAALPANVMHYPTNLQAPDNFDKASEHPIGTGPFKFVSWKRFGETRLVRFENYWETDAAGNNLPYLDSIVGAPKRDDIVRLTALRTGELNLIDHMAYSTVEDFKKNYGDKFQLWQLHLGGVFVEFNWRSDIFKDKNLRVAAAHAIDRDAIHYAVFYEQARALTQPYPPGNSWHLDKDGYKVLEYDPDKAKSMLKKAKATGTEIVLLARTSPAYNAQCGELLQAMWTDVGFKVRLDPVDSAVETERLRKGDFHAHIQGHSYRFDPDTFFDRNLHSQSAYGKMRHAWQNERYDKLIEEAKRIPDQSKRRELYTEGWKIVHEELPQFHLHELSMVSAAHQSVKDYEPSTVAPFTYRGGGIRVAYIQT
jgi:peptide/nickel transport system substrate-binding protein